MSSPHEEDAKGLRLVGHTDLGGAGDGMHVNVVGGIAYVGHMGYSDVATSIVDVSDPRSPRLLSQIPRLPGTHSHKVQVVGDILVANHEKNIWEKTPAESWSAGLAVYDVSRPDRPEQIGFFETPGSGVHRMTWWDGDYAYVTAGDDGYLDQFLRIIDLSRPDRPTEAGRWWYPGQHTAGGETPDWAPTSGHHRGPNGEMRVALHHALVEDGIAYCGYWDAGLVMLDVSSPSAPSLIAHLPFDPELSSGTHTALPVPGRALVAVTDEQVQDGPNAPVRNVWMVDVADVSRPRVISRLPVPEGDYAERPGRFGPHNLHEPRPGSLVDSDHLYLTYFNAGLRVFDIADAARPREIAHYVPPAPAGRPVAQLNDLTVTADGLIYVTDRFAGGLYILERV